MSAIPKPGVKIGQFIAPQIFDHPEPGFDISPALKTEELQAYYSFLNVRFMYRLYRPLPFVPILRERIDDPNVLGKTMVTCNLPYDDTFEQRLMGTVPWKIIVSSDYGDTDSVKQILHHEAMHVYCIFYYGDYKHSSLWRRIAEETGYKPVFEEVYIDPGFSPGQFVEQL